MSLYDRDYMRPGQQPQRSPLAWFAQWTPLRWIIVVNIVVFCLQHLGFDVWVDKLPGPEGGPPIISEQGGVSIQALLQGRVWTLFTYMFVHHDLLHIAGNLLLIGFIGSRVQSLLGARNFVFIYFLSGLIGAGLQLIVQYFCVKQGMEIPIVGASASACGLLLAYASVLPEERITTAIYFIIPVTARLWTLSMWIMGIELVMGVLALIWAPARDWWGQNAYFAHLGGAAAGWNYVRLLGYGGNPMTYERLWRERRVGPRPLRREVARVRRARATPDIDYDAARRRKEKPGQNAVPLMDDVDTILDKINRHGIASLTEEERRTLDDASRVISKRQDRKG